MVTNKFWNRPTLFLTEGWQTTKMFVEVRSYAIEQTTFSSYPMKPIISIRPLYATQKTNNHLRIIMSSWLFMMNTFLKGGMNIVCNNFVSNPWLRERLCDTQICDRPCKPAANWMEYFFRFSCVFSALLLLMLRSIDKYMVVGSFWGIFRLEFKIDN